MNSHLGVCYANHPTKGGVYGARACTSNNLVFQVALSVAPCVWLTFVCFRYFGWLFRVGLDKGSRGGGGLGVSLPVSA